MVHDHPEKGSYEDRDEEPPGEEPGEGKLLGVADPEDEREQKRGHGGQAEADESAADMLVVKGLRSRE